MFFLERARELNMLEDEVNYVDISLAVVDTNEPRLAQDNPEQKLSLSEQRWIFLSEVVNWEQIFFVLTQLTSDKPN